jgi:predicted O-methyltransferase YrrM
MGTMNPALTGLPQGWFHHGERILELVAEHQPCVCVELGSWRGASAIALTRTIQPWGGTLYCIDTWAGQVNGSRGGTLPVKPAMVLECASNLVAAGVAARTRLIVAPTEAAAAAWSGPIDFLYIDADHTEASVRADLEAWWPHLRPGGLIAGDDYDNPMYPGVKAAWDAFEAARGQAFERFATPHTNPPGMRLIWGTKRDDGGDR